MEKIIIEPIAFVKNSRIEVIDDYWGGVISEIELIPSIPAETLDGIESFSHIEIIYYFHKLNKSSILWNSGHPRENKNWPKVGIFAQRKKNRPNLIGATIAEIVKREGNKLFVKNLDAINGTPVIDIKPVLKEFLPQEKIIQPEWSSELMKNYWSTKN